MARGPRNRRPDLNGLLVIDKPLGRSSASICAEIRRRTSGAKVGHAGTLDPLATGVLLLCLGRATKAVPALMATSKRYQAEVDLSAFSTTDDLEGERTVVEVAAPPSEEAVREALTGFVGEIDQRPPVYSAVHVEGERAYKRARRGAADERPPARRVTIHGIELHDYAWPRLTIDVHCGKGVYIRSLARDLGEALGTGGMLTALRRTAVGRFNVDQAAAPDALPDPIESALLELPSDLVSGPGRPARPSSSRPS